MPYLHCLNPLNIFRLTRGHLFLLHNPRSHSEDHFITMRPATNLELLQMHIRDFSASAFRIIPHPVLVNTLRPRLTFTKVPNRFCHSPCVPAAPGVHPGTPIVLQRSPMHSISPLTIRPCRPFLHLQARAALPSTMQCPVFNPDRLEIIALQQAPQPFVPLLEIAHSWLKSEFKLSSKVTDQFPEFQR